MPFSAKAKSLLRNLVKFQHWVTKEQAEKGMGLVQPFFLAQTAKDKQRASSTITTKLSPGVMVEFKKTNRCRQWTMDAEWRKPHLEERERLSPSFIQAITHCEWRELVKTAPWDASQGILQKANYPHQHATGPLQPSTCLGKGICPLSQNA